MRTMKTTARVLEERTFPVFNVMGVISGLGLVIMMMLVVIDAVGRRFFSFPIYGSYEGVNFLLSMIFFFSLGFCTAKKGHFSMDIVTSHFPRKLRKSIVTVMSLISFLICWLVAYRLVLLGMLLKADGLTGVQLTFFPVYILAYMGTFCLAMMGWGFLVQFLSLLSEITERSD